MKSLQPSGKETGGTPWGEGRSPLQPWPGMTWPTLLSVKPQSTVNLRPGDPICCFLDPVYLPAVFVARQFLRGDSAAPVKRQRWVWAGVWRQPRQGQCHRQRHRKVSKEARKSSKWTVINDGGWKSRGKQWGCRLFPGQTWHARLRSLKSIPETFVTGFLWSGSMVESPYLANKNVRQTLHYIWDSVKWWFLSFVRVWPIQYLGHTYSFLLFLLNKYIVEIQVWELAFSK